ncbi:MAG: hypothetical protein FIA92_15530 [Chloroflexi bacterium]|nr:hypothetical protein [Chloroflexota bacterium]
MNFSALSQNDRIALVAGGVVAIAALISLVYNWGAIMIISLLAGLLAVVVIIQPSLLATLRLRGSKGSLLLIAGVGAALVNVLTGVDYLTWLTEHLVSFDALQFIVGIVAAIALLYAGWMAYRAEGTMTASAAPAPAAPPPAPAPPSA